MSLILSFLVLITAVLWFVIGSKGSWFVKFIFITVAIFVALGTSYSLENLKGWPTTETIPDKFQVYWVVIDEPNKKSGDVGGIYMWLGDRSETSDDFVWQDPFRKFLIEDFDKPRAFEIPYDFDLHMNLDAMLPIFKAGIGVGGELEKKIDTSEQTPMGNFVFYPLPPSSPPDKNQMRDDN